MTATIEVSTVIAAHPAEVWVGIEDIGTHTRWMADAEAWRTWRRRVKTER